MSLTRVMELSELGKVAPVLLELRSLLWPVSDGTLSTTLEVLICAVICGRGICCTLALFTLGAVGVLLFLDAVGMLSFSVL
jgi:hypothetical protein